MATCRGTQGHARDCDFVVGGLKKLYYTNLDDIASWTEATDETYTDVTMVEYTITDITEANPAVVTAPGHTFVEGDLVWITGTTTMTGVEGQFTVGAVTATTFELADVDTTSSGAFLGSTLVAGRGWFEVEFDQNTSSATGDYSVANGNRFYPQAIQILISPASNETRKLDKQLALAKTVWAAEWNDGTTKLYFVANGGQKSEGTVTSGVAFEDFAGFTTTIGGAEKDPYIIYDDSTNALPVFAN